MKHLDAMLGICDPEPEPTLAVGSGALVRPEFVARMEAELLANQGKGDWRQWQPSQLEVLAEMEHHVAKLIMSLAANERGAQNKAVISEHCADIANIAMKAEERFGWPNIDSAAVRQHINQSKALASEQG